MLDIANPILSHALTFLTGFVPLLVYLLANQRKKLGYAITRSFEIVTVNKPILAHTITVLVDGKEAKQLRSTEILLQNVGTKDIQEQEVSIWIAPPAEIINFVAIYDPPGYVPKFSPFHKNVIGMEFSLLNPGDRVTLHCLTANDPVGSCKVTARGPNFILKRFNPDLFVSPLVNGIVAVLWIMIWAWTCIWLSIRIIDNPKGQTLWQQILTLSVLQSIAVVFALGLYASTIRAYKGVAEWFRRGKSDAYMRAK